MEPDDEMFAIGAPKKDTMHSTVQTRKCARRGVLTKNCCRINGQARPQLRGMAMNDKPDIYERTPERPESSELRVEKSSVVANVIIAGRLIKGAIDTGATRTIIKSSLQDVIPFVSEATNINTIIRMELLSTVRVGETHFQLPLIVLDDVVDNLTLGMDFLIKARETLVIGERAIQFGNTVKRPKDLWSGKPFDTITTPAHDITSVRDPASSSVVETKHVGFIRQAPTTRRDNAFPTRVDLSKEQRIKKIHHTPCNDVRDKVKHSEPSEKFSNCSKQLSTEANNGTTRSRSTATKSTTNSNISKWPISHLGYKNGLRIAESRDRLDKTLRDRRLCGPAKKCASRPRESSNVAPRAMNPHKKEYMDTASYGVTKDVTSYGTLTAPTSRTACKTPDDDGVCLRFLIPVDSDKSDEIAQEPSPIDEGKLLPPRHNDPGWQGLPKNINIYQQLVAKFPSAGKRGRVSVSRDRVWYRESPIWNAADACLFPT
uniref:Uncharacterized protein n=1 Tax=Glossina pallidipes TaxID=7398 RepID=A0A1A9ZXL0_GLOPL